MLFIDTGSQSEICERTEGGVLIDEGKGLTLEFSQNTLEARLENCQAQFLKVSEESRD